VLLLSQDTPPPSSLLVHESNTREGMGKFVVLSHQNGQCATRQKHEHGSTRFKPIAISNQVWSNWNVPGKAMVTSCSTLVSSTYREAKCYCGVSDWPVGRDMIARLLGPVFDASHQWPIYIVLVFKVVNNHLEWLTWAISLGGYKGIP
jgi:hypothetical protein